MPVADKKLASYLTDELFTYCSDGMGYKLYEQPHREMCGFFESMLPPPPHEMKDAEQKYGMFLGPRETYKTSVVQGLIEYFLLKWKILYNYDGRALIVRASHDDAKSVILAISQDLSNNNPVLQRAFGDLSVDSKLWSSDKLVLNWREANYREPSVDTRGSGMSATGYHFDLVVIDDIANEKNFESETEMKKAWRTIQAMMPVLNSGGSMIVIGTRWGYNDPYGKILEVNERTENENLERVKKKKPPIPLPWNVMIRSVYLPNGDLYYPAHLSEKKIDQKRRGMEEKMFTACYLNQVIQDSSRVFKPDHLRFYDGTYTFDYDEGPTLQVTDGAYLGLDIPVRCTMHIDPASTATKTSNYTAIAVVLTDADMNMWVHEAWKGKEVPSEIRSRIVAMARHFEPEELSIDTLGQQVLWVDDIERDLKEAGLKTRVLLHKGKALKDGHITTGIRSKASRIESLEPWFREGRIFLRRGKCQDIVTEFNFYDGPTQSNHFDMLDALAQAPVFIKRPALTYRARTLDDEEEWEEEFGDDPRPKVKGTWAGR